MSFKCFCRNCNGEENLCPEQFWFRVRNVCIQVSPLLIKKHYILSGEESYLTRSGLFSEWVTLSAADRGSPGTGRTLCIITLVKAKSTTGRSRSFIHSHPKWVLKLCHAFFSKARHKKYQAVFFPHLPNISRYAKTKCCRQLMYKISCLFVLYLYLVYYIFLNSNIKNVY